MLCCEHIETWRLLHPTLGIVTSVRWIWITHIRGVHFFFTDRSFYASKEDISEISKENNKALCTVPDKPRRIRVFSVTILIRKGILIRIFSLLEMSVKYRKSRIKLWWMRDIRLNLLILVEKFYFLKSKVYD